MEIAKQWNITPMKLTGGSKTLWYARACAVRESEIRRNHKAESEAKRRAEQIEEARRNR
jgi:hypothetical protein